MTEKLNITTEQEYILARHSRMVGKVLDLIEASMPEGTQCEKFKSLYKYHCMIFVMTYSS